MLEMLDVALLYLSYAVIHIIALIIASKMRFEPLNRHM